VFKSNVFPALAVSSSDLGAVTAVISDTMATPSSSRPSFFTGKVKTALAVAYFSWAGMALRLGLVRLTETLHFGLTMSDAKQSWYCLQTTSASGYFLQNMLGCLLIAIVARHKLLMNEHIAAGLGTGLCGSLTTWATWMQQEAATIVNGEVWMAFVSLICMLCVCLSMFSLGEIIANGGMDVPVAVPINTSFTRKARAAGCGESSGEESARSTSSSVDDMGDEEDSIMPGASVAEGDWTLDLCPEPPEREPSEKEIDTQALDRLILGVSMIVILVALGLIVWFKRVPGAIYFALAPFGALLRWFLSLGNPYTAPFPVFTLLENTLGCGVDALAGVMAGRAAPGGFEHHVWVGLGTGFGGCLSTVSTFVVELRNDKLGGFRMRAAYFLLSFGLAMAVLLPVSAYVPCMKR